VYVADYGIAYGETAGDQTSKVNSAISAAVSQGKTLVFPANQVIAINGVLDFKSLTVIGQGCRLFLMAGHDGGSGGGGWQWMKLGVGGKMSGMIIDGNRANQGDGIFGNVHGIRLMGNNVFEYNTVKRVTSYGVVLYAGSPPTNVYIRNNVFDDIGQYGVTTGCTDGDYCYGHNVVVTDNTFRECHEVGVKLRGTVGATIARNTITVGTRLPGRDTPSGIRLYSWDDPNWDIVIQDNTITGLDGDGTTCIDSDDSQNYRITITGNTISHCDTGIELQFTGGTITNNKISNCNSCITGSSGNTVTGNTCT
jgi:parallel beta-helix repeat protein